MSERMTAVGRVAGLWRYPVKSMQGETREAVEVGANGVLGDRALALIDVETGRVVSAKNPRRWPVLFGFSAACVAEPAADAPRPRVRIEFPGGETVEVDGPDETAAARLSAALGRPVRLATASGDAAEARGVAEGYWPDADWLPAPDSTFEFRLPAGTFFDGAPIHLVTTATLKRLAAAAPGSRFDPARFRPNLLIETEEDGAGGFVEDGWIGRTLVVGGVTLRVTEPSPRCVMTTLPQGDLPPDPGVLRTAVRENGSNVGVYATVVAPGRVAVGDGVSLG